MKLQLWINNPAEWDKLSLIEKIKILRKYYCTGPCGQSLNVIQTRSVLEKTLKEVESILESL